MNLSRRTFGGVALGALPLARTVAATSLPSVFGGVRLAIGSYSFRAVTVDEMVAGVASIPLGTVELESWFVEPGVAAAGRGGMKPEQRDALRQWRLGSPLDEVKAVRRKFDDAGIRIYAYNIPLDDACTEAEIDRVFPMAQALGADVLNVVTSLAGAERLVAPSAKYKMRVGFHPTGGQAAGGIRTGDDWRKVIALAPNFGINPDLGQRANWGPDPLAFLREMHGRITTLHTHDSAPFGEGTAPVKEILLMVQKEKFTFVPVIERSYPLKPGMDNVAQIKQLTAYCEDVLAGK